MQSELVGVLFGQLSCIDRHSLRMVIRRVLLAKEEITEELRGDIIAEEYVNADK
jgi:hypothetical protein